MAVPAATLLSLETSSFRLPSYISRGGYEAARRTLLSKKPGEVVDEVKRANLRGRGGAGFPAGSKWAFVPPADGRPRYLCVNADEGEPGTFKDRAIMTRDPHLLLEGIVIASYAVGVHTAFIYIRAEYEAVARRLEAAVEEARAAGFLGPNVFGSGFDLEVFVHRGAGSYICGEETALLESIEGKKGWPRLRPPFPAAVGLFRAPTVINNVETIANVPLVFRDGAEAFAARGLPKDGGTRLFGVSGAVRRPGLYELPVGTPLRRIIDEWAGGPAEGQAIKAVCPGGLSAPFLTPDELDVAMDYESLARAGSMLGSAGIIVVGDRTPMIDVLRIVTRFYAHESCGQCTPCRIGTTWISKVVARMAAAGGMAGDLALIRRLAEGMKGRTLCPMGDAAAFPVLSILAKFEKELSGTLSG
ncbi:MAG TPA: NADH-quinone oxidoreductase subunit NuoF [Terriglobales bacterium]|nr:NADH-quinone oxidoreductase subunit NuoF [Terriglobales bacterium]